MMKAFVGAAAVVAADAATLKLTWSDCGGQHVKITDFAPATLTTGKKTTMTGTGNLDEDVSAANFDLEMNTAAGTVSCKGDAGTSKTCNLPHFSGSLTFNAMSFPMKKGSTSVSVDLSPSLALAYADTFTKVTATATNGDSLFCVKIKTAPTCLNEKESKEWGCGPVYTGYTPCCPGLDCWELGGEPPGVCAPPHKPPTVNASIVV